MLVCAQSGEYKTDGSAAVALPHSAYKLGGKELEREPEQFLAWLIAW